MIEPIEVVAVVNASPQDAFRAFVDDINNWWPITSFSMSKGTLTLEQKIGGKIIETSVDGQIFVWGHVTGWDTPNHLEIAWYVGGTPDKATHISVRFATTDDGRTGVTLVQSGWEALGDQAATTRARNAGGWITILCTHYVAHVSKTCPPTAKHVGEPNA